MITFYKPHTIPFKNTRIVYCCNKAYSVYIIFVVIKLLSSHLYLSSIKVNDLNHQLFKTWSDQFPKQVHLVSDGTTHNDNRLGAVGCMELAIKHFNINDDVIVIGGYI